MRARPVLVLACLAATVAGCGGENEPRAQKPAPAVDLEVTSPNDLATVSDQRVEVRGTVEPAGAAVMVLGQRAPVTGGGTFRATVPLDSGVNVIDVMASATGRSPALTAFRVTREVPVTVPDLQGKKVPDVEKTLRDLGLGVEVDEEGGLLEEVLPGDPAVCMQTPPAGVQVRRGTKVRVTVSKRC
jgi:hypothetical protein